MSEVVQKLDWSLETSEERLQLLNTLLDGNDYFTDYCTKYLNVNVTTNDNLSEDNSVIKIMSVFGDYILMGTDKQRPLPLTDYDIPDNYYKSNNIVVTKSDFLNSEYGEVLLAYDSFKNLIRQSDLSKTKQDRLIGELNKDMVCAKTHLQKPIVFLHCSRSVEPIHWLEADYTNHEQVKQMLRIPNSSIFSDIGIIGYDIDSTMKELNLSHSEKKIINASRLNQSATFEELSLITGFSRQYVDKVFKQVAYKIADYEKKIEKKQKTFKN